MTWLGIWANLGLFALKALAGVLGRSAAMIADAGHTLSDLVSDMGALLVGCDMCTCFFFFWFRKMGGIVRIVLTRCAPRHT